MHQSDCLFCIVKIFTRKLRDFQIQHTQYQNTGFDTVTYFGICVIKKHTSSYTASKKSQQREARTKETLSNWIPS